MNMRKATLGVAALILALGAVKADECGSSCGDKSDCGSSCSEGNMGAVKAKPAGCCSESKTN